MGNVMDLLHDNIFWILILSGGLTATMLAAAVAPVRVLQSFFGSTVEGRLGDLLMRNWGLLVGMSGVLLIYAAWDEAVRIPAMLFAIIGKLVFALYVLFAGPDLKSARGSAMIDLLIVGIFVTYLASL